MQKASWTEQELPDVNLREVKPQLTDTDELLKAAYPENAMELLIDDMVKHEVIEAFEEVQKAYHYLSGLKYVFKELNSNINIPEEAKEAFQGNMQKIMKSKSMLAKAMLNISKQLEAYGIDPNE